MGKRKSFTPKHVDEAKRKLLTWNMTDQIGDPNIESQDSLSKEQCSTKSVAAPTISQYPQKSASAMDTSRDELLSELIMRSHFYLTVQRSIKTIDQVNKFHIGNIQLRLSNVETFGDDAHVDAKQDPPPCDKFYLYINLDKKEHLLYYEYIENDENQEGSSVSDQIQATKRLVTYFLAYSEMPAECFEGLNNKMFHLVLERYDRDSMEMILNVYLYESGLSKMKFAAEAGKMKKWDKALHILVCYWYGIESEDFSNLTYVKKHDIDEVLKAIKEEHMKEKPLFTTNVQHPCLKPSLREYQKLGVQWMLGKEQYFREKIKTANDTEIIHPLYQEIVTVDRKKLYFNKYLGYLCKEKPQFVSSPPGGILGDEMGLGKTVEVLACILCHPRTDLPAVKKLPVLNNENEDRTLMLDAEVIQSEVEVQISEQEEVVETSISKNQQSTKNSNILESTILNNPSQKSDNLLEVNAAEKSTEEINSDTTSHRDSSIGTQAEKRLNVSPRPCISKENGNRRKSLGSKSKRGTVEYVEIDEDETSYWTVESNRQFFECVCGSNNETVHINNKKLISDSVQCEKCNLWQHAKCVNYNLKDPYRGCFLCPHCHVSSTPIPSGATLIVSPNSICHQWVDEILKHIKTESLNVFVYEGVTKQGFIQPQKLANQDIVLTTYETLRREIDYVDLPHSNSTEGRQLRKPKRYMATPSPIIAVEWWRICLDEAQMVECTSTKTANMALRLHAVNRWCVTGTPIQRGIEDVYGLLLFLGLDPYWVHQWWKTLLFDPFCYGRKDKLIKVLGSVLWRTVKKDVLNEICLPLQSENIHVLTFSPVEEHFYKRQFQACSREAMNKLRKYQDNSLKLNELDRHSLHQLLLPLTKLRQACCHPQAVKGEFIPIHKSMMTMEELLTQLTKKAKLECEEAHRQCVAANNGMAALHIIDGHLSEAVEMYRDVLRSVEEHSKDLRTDELQQLHAMHNLNEILRTEPKGVAPTLRDSQLSDQCHDIRTKYMQKAENFVTAAHQVWIPIEKSLRELQVEFRKGKTWWADLIEHFMRIHYDQYLIEKIKEDLADNATPGVESIIRKFRDGRGLLFLLSHHLDELQTTHDRLVNALRQLNDAAKNDDIIKHTVDCCLRPSGDDDVEPCVFCKSNDYFDEYEGKLFFFVEKGMETHFDGALEDHSVHTKRQGTWADSEIEKTLKTLINFSKTRGGDHQLLEYGNIHIKIFDALKKEFKAMRTVWIETKANVASVDELDMATTRIRLRLPGEPATDPPQPNIIDKSEIEAQRLKFTSDQIVGRNELRKKLGQLLYLRNLSKTQSAIESGKNPDPCPICQRELGCRWSVMHCGHCFCMECMRMMISRYSFGGSNGSMKCPVCRQKTRHADIAYVSTKKNQAETDGFKIKGDHSTKVEGVVKCLLHIQKEDPDAKCLVFSTWQDVLGVLSKALDDNHVSYRSLTSHKFQINLASFKHEPDIKVLLLPVHSGANGLNLIEATHVILVEPVLNPAQELQAIGRVHRIGQTRPTFVHRFLVKGTIEEKISSLLQTTQASSIINSHNSEETTFTIGDFKALFEEEEFMNEEEEDDNDIVQGPDSDNSNSQPVNISNTNHVIATTSNSETDSAMDFTHTRNTQERNIVSIGDTSESFSVTDNGVNIIDARNNQQSYGIGYNSDNFENGTDTSNDNNIASLDENIEITNSESRNEQAACGSIEECPTTDEIQY